MELRVAEHRDVMLAASPYRGSEIPICRPVPDAVTMDQDNDRAQNDQMVALADEERDAT
jgi:hypothetical protein